MAIELANHIYRDGEGVPVVLMNAYPVDHRMWDVCAKALADFADLNDVPDFPIWAPDMAGSGASPVPSDADSGPRMANGAYSEALDRLAGAYVDLIKAAGYEQAIWVGLSMGGYVAMAPASGSVKSAAVISSCCIHSVIRVQYRKLAPCNINTQSFDSFIAF